MPLTPAQLELAQLPFDRPVFLEGPAGAGKTRAAVERMLGLLQQGVRGDQILVLLPQRTLASPYSLALQESALETGSPVTITTLAGLAKRMVELFWPLVAEPAGFAFPNRPPNFLTLETAQYFMRRVTDPLYEKGAFSSISVDRNRLYSQILDNLNKAAAVGFPYGEIGERLHHALGHQRGKGRLYQETQQAVSLFREFCLAHNLLDYSLQVELFRRDLWPEPLCRDYLRQNYRHLIYDNIEEDTPAAHDVVRLWWEDFDSAMLVYDCEAGYRSFLGADPDSASRLRTLCREQRHFEESLVVCPPLNAFGLGLGWALQRGQPLPPPSLLGQLPQVIQPSVTHRFHTEMLDWAAGEIARLVHEEQVPAGEIVVLTPFLSDALRFSLLQRLESRAVPAYSQRPSRALREEPAVQCLLTLAALAHPAWQVRPSTFDVASALVVAVQDLDLVRAQLLVERVYQASERSFSLSSFNEIPYHLAERITYLFGERYETLRAWLEAYQSGPALDLDHFIGRLFGEVLSQKGFGFHHNFAYGEAAARMMESAREFRWVADSGLFTDGNSLAQEYLAMVRQGVMAAQYLRDWQPAPQQAVLLAPAYTFLLANRPVQVQFWLDISSRGWFERLDQPVTHPYVLRRDWPEGAVWTEQHEFEAGQAELYRLALGLIRRCRQKIYLGLSRMNEQGMEFRGPFLRAVDKLLQQAQSAAWEAQDGL